MTDQQEDYADEWDDVPEKVILAQIMTELQQIRLLLSEGDTRASDGGESEDAYVCLACDATVPAADREQHAQKQHKAPPDRAHRLFEPAD
jgi:hypothetical protein